MRLEGRPAGILGVARRSVRNGLKLEIAGIEVVFGTPVPQSGGGGFRAQARILPGLRKDFPKARRFVVSSFVVSLFCRFVVRCVVVLPFYRWVAPPVDEEIY